MALEDLRDVLLCSTLINYGVILVWFLVLQFTHGRIHRLHNRWFRLSVETFDAIHYGAMAAYKVGILLLNLVPFIALSFMT